MAGNTIGRKPRRRTQRGRFFDQSAPCFECGATVHGIRRGYQGRAVCSDCSREIVLRENAYQEYQRQLRSVA